jgi:hypothetical protein
MARNLISLSTPDDKGYKYRGGNKVLKVSKDSIIHMIGDINSTKLYVLRGSTLPSIAATVTSNEHCKLTLACTSWPYEQTWHGRIDQERAVSWLQHEYAGVL